MIQQKSLGICVPVFIVMVTVMGCARQDEIGPKPHPITPPTQQVINHSITRGIDFLVGYQNKNGSWGSATLTKDMNIYAPVPGGHQAFRAACTALCVSALIESGDQRPQVIESIERGEQWIFKYLPKVRRTVPECLYNNWAHAYGTRALVRMFKRLPDDVVRRAKLIQLIEQQVDMLRRFESLQSGWGYLEFGKQYQRTTAGGTPFLTGTVLIAFHEASQLGVNPPQHLIDRSLAHLQRHRSPDGAFVYSDSHWIAPRNLINRSTGSLARSQVCHLAMRLWGDDNINDKVLTTWLNRLYARTGWLDMARKTPLPHEAYAQNSGYFYYYGMFYAAGVIELLPPKKQPYHQSHLASIIMKLQEKDGSWWDYPLYDYHKPYGTAYAIMAMTRCRELEPAVIKQIKR